VVSVVERSRWSLVNAALLVAFASRYAVAGLTDYGRAAAVDWWNVGLMVVLATLHVLEYTSATFRRWLDDLAVLARVGTVAFVFAIVLFYFHGPTPAWMFALVGVVAALTPLGERVDAKSLRASRSVQVAALVVAVGFVAFGVSFLARSLDRSSVAAATLSAAAGLVVAWLAFRWQRAVARTE
jgi:hypothetical protein